MEKHRGGKAGHVSVVVAPDGGLAEEFREPAATGAHTRGSTRARGGEENSIRAQTLGKRYAISASKRC